MQALNLPRGSNQVVKEVFTKTSQAAMAGHVYDPATSKNVGGLAKVLLAIDSPEAQIAADELEEGGSRKSATEKVNEYRLTRGLEHVGQGAVYSLMRRLGVDTKRVRKAPQGDFDPDSKWAAARYNWVRQIAVMFRTWQWDPADGACPAHFDPRLIAHIERTQVAWWDETSKKCVLDGAHTSLYHHRFKRNADGKLDSNGTLRERIACTVPKFQQRADLVLGVAVVE